MFLQLLACFSFSSSDDVSEIITDLPYGQPTSAESASIQAGKIQYVFWSASSDPSDTKLNIGELLQPDDSRNHCSVDKVAVRQILPNELLLCLVDGHFSTTPPKFAYNEPAYKAYLP